MPFTAQSYVNGSIVQASWLNGVDQMVYNILGGWQGQTLPIVQAALGIPVGGIAVPVPLAQGGTGGTTQAQALLNLGAATLAQINASYIGGQLYPATAAEKAALATIGGSVVNLNYVPGCVDRYVSNATPGTGSIDCALGFNAAFQVARALGFAVIYGDTAPYLCLTSINCTTAGSPNQPGILIYYKGAYNENPPTQSIIANHNSHVFDFTGTATPVLMNVSIGNVTQTVANNTNVPQTAFLLARNNSSGTNTGYGVQNARFLNCSVVGQFCEAIYYNFAAESDKLSGCYFNNTYTSVANPQSAVVVWTGNNIFNLQSQYQPVFANAGAGGHPQSSTHHIVEGGSFVTAGGSTSLTDIFYVEQSDFVAIRDAYTAQTGGGARSMMYVDMTYHPSSYGQVTGHDGELPSDAPQYGILFSSNIQTPVGWNISDCRLPSVVRAISVAGSSLNPTMDNFFIKNIQEGSSPNGISWPGVVTGTYIFDPNLILGIGTAGNASTGSKYNKLIGDTSKWTIPYRTADSWDDTGVTNSFIASCTNSGWTSSAGGLICYARTNMIGRFLEFEVIVASGSGNLSCSAGATVTLTAPGGQNWGPVPTGTATAFGGAMIVDQTSGAVGGVSITSTGSNPTSALLTIPVAISAAAHVQVITGKVFLA